MLGGFVPCWAACVTGRCRRGAILRHWPACRHPAHGKHHPSGGLWRNHPGWRFWPARSFWPRSRPPGSCSRPPISSPAMTSCGCTSSTRRTSARRSFQDGCRSGTPTWGWDARSWRTSRRPRSIRRTSLSFSSASILGPRHASSCTRPWPSMAACAWAGRSARRLAPAGLWAPGSRSAVPSPPAWMSGSSRDIFPSAGFPFFFGSGPACRTAGVPRTAGGFAAAVGLTILAGQPPLAYVEFLGLFVFLALRMRGPSGCGCRWRGLSVRH